MLELRHIQKRYDERTVLEDISLSVETGEIVSILGPSGCGKTTLLNIILGLVEPSSGRILCDGEDLTRVPMEKRGFNIVFQDYALFPNLNAYENIVYGLRNNPNASTPQEVEELIDLLGLRKPLDGIIKESIKERIRTVARQYKLTTLIVTHDPEEALTLSDRVLIINEGKIAQFADPQTIISDPANDFIRQFILSQLNIKRTNILKLFSESVPQTTAASSLIAKPQPFQSFGQAVA